MTARIRVAVVDDDAAGLKATVRILSKDFDAAPFMGPRDLLVALRSGQSFDVLVSDVQMPDITGPDLYGILSEEFPALVSRILFMTGGGPDDVLEFLAPRAPVLFRPVPPTALIRAVSVLASK